MHKKEVNKKRERLQEKDSNHVNPIWSFTYLVESSFFSSSQESRENLLEIQIEKRQYALCFAVCHM